MKLSPCFSLVYRLVSALSLRFDATWNIIAITIMDEVVAVINSSFSSVLGGATGTSLVFIVHQSLVSLKHSMDQLLGGTGD